MFLTPARASANDRSPWGDFWFTPVGMASASGMRVTPDIAMQLSAVYACVRVLAETMAALPLVLYRRTDDGGKTVVRDHWLFKLLAGRPNARQNAFEWREMMQGHLALRGNAYNRIIANGRGEVEQLLPLHPDAVTIEHLDTGTWRFRVRQRDGTEQVLTRSEVWHLRGLSGDGISGLNPIELARDNIGTGIAAQNYGARFFANDARPGGWIEHPGNFRDIEARSAWRASWQQQQAGANRGKTAVLEYGMKYHALEVNNADAQFIETRRYQVEDIARLFRVPPHLIQDLSRSTNNNIEHQSLDFVIHTMTPWAERWEAAIESDLLLEDEAAEIEVEFDFTNLLRGDSKARSERYASGIMNGWMTRNEARMQENFNPLDGLDEPLLPLNMVTAKQGAARPAQLPVPDDDGAGEDAAAATHERAQALAQATAARVARKETAMLLPLMAVMPMPAAQIESAMEKHAEFVATVLNVTPASARSYIEARGADAIRRGHEEHDIYAAAYEKLTLLALKGTL